MLPSVWEFSSSAAVPPLETFAIPKGRTGPPVPRKRTLSAPFWCFLGRPINRTLETTETLPRVSRGAVRCRNSGQ